MNAKQRSEIEAPPASSLEAIARCIPTCGIDMGYCCVGGSETKRSFNLANVLPKGTTGSTVRFSLEMDENLFSVSPDNGKCNHQPSLAFSNFESRCAASKEEPGNHRHFQV
jgi:hypothetical protein